MMSVQLSAICHFIKAAAGIQLWFPLPDSTVAIKTCLWWKKPVFSFCYRVHISKKFTMKKEQEGGRVVSESEGTKERNLSENLQGVSKYIQIYSR